jgi:hypothetical protein
MATTEIVLPEKSTAGEGVAVGVAVGAGAPGTGVAVAVGAGPVVGVAVGGIDVGVGVGSLPHAETTSASAITNAVTSNRCFIWGSFFATS